MYVRLCTVRLADLGPIQTLLQNHGLLPLIRSVPDQTPTTSEDTCYSIELPADDIEKGRKILAASRAEKGLAR